MKASDCDVVVRDVGVDAAVTHQDNGRPLLMLRPYMSRGAAVQAIMGVLPAMPADEAAKIVREALPHAPDLDDVLLARQTEMPTRAPRWRRALSMPLGWPTMVVLCLSNSAMAVVMLWPSPPAAPAPPVEIPEVLILPLQGEPGMRVCVAQSVAWRCSPPEKIVRANLTSAK